MTEASRAPNLQVQTKEVIERKNMTDGIHGADLILHVAQVDPLLHLIDIEYHTNVNSCFYYVSRILLKNRCKKYLATEFTKEMNYTCMLF